MFRVFSGFDSRQAEAAEVFAFSVRENSSIDVGINPVSADKGCFQVCKRTGVTAFSYARFMVPYHCGYEGVAAFFDGCDMLCLGDVAELASFDLGGKPLAVVKHPDTTGLHRRPRVWSSVMLMDCAQLRHWTPEYVETAPDAKLMRFQDFDDEQIGELPPKWNVLMDGDRNRRSVESGILAPLMHWSYLSDPNGGSWIDRSGSALWQEWRERWRASKAT